MKEKMIYVAVDADDIGEIIGDAILSDNRDKLSSVSGKINAGLQVFARWAEYNGGDVVSSGSDEAIFSIPETSLKELQDVKNKYQEKTGFSVSIGTGEKISDAAKALIYAKANGKNQIVEYSSSIEDSLKQAVEGSGPKKDQQLIGGVGDDTAKEDVDEKQLEMGSEVEKEHTSDEDQAEEIALDHLTEDPIYYSKLSEMESSDEEDDEEDDDNATPDATPEALDSKEDLDVDGRPDSQESHGKLSEEDDLDGDGDIEHEEAIASRSGEDYDDAGDEEDEYLDENDDSFSDAIENEMSEEDSEEMPAEEDQEMPAEEDQEMPAEEDQEMSEEDSEEMSEEDSEEMPAEDSEEMPAEDSEEMPAEEDQEMSAEEDQEMSAEEDQEMSAEEDGLTEDSLKQAIYESLQIFKENKDFLNSLSQENPDLHNALVVSLQAMIEMAKELGYGQETELAGEEDLNPDDFLVSEEEDQSEDTGIEKKEIIYKIIEKITKTIPKESLSKKEVLETLKEKMKEKINSKISKDKKNKRKNIFGQQKKKPKPKKIDSSSFCATSNQKMKTSGKDCRANEDKNSPICAARKKMNCRGKNAEKGPAIEKSEKLKNFLERERKK